MVVTGNMRIIRVCVPAIDDANFAANRGLNKKEVFAVGKQVQFELDKFEARTECESWQSLIMCGFESVVHDARLSKIFKNIG